VTGTSFLSVEAAGKSLEVLKHVVPKLHRVALLWNPANPVFQAQMVKEMEAAARSLGIQLRLLGARDANEIDVAFKAMEKERPEALAVIVDPVFIAQRTRITTLAAKSRLPSVSAFSEYAEAGGLMAYAPNFSESGARAAAQVDKILKGAKPADLPVEQPTKFDLVLNLKTAKALGITIPQSLLLRADEVIE
jgi:putative ABC transport system substrate-binding protein